jgi:tetratricopeptide (TPR) repeat protein
MLTLPGIFRGLAGAALCAALAGCLPSSQGPLDEQKEAHFLAGKARLNALDVQGAQEAFEKALEVNPRSGSAHFELGLLCEKDSDYAAAIYHFERFLKLRPESDYAALVKERISADKIELSKQAAFFPVTSKLTGELEKLTEENKQLRAEVEKWRAFSGQPPHPSSGSNTSNGGSSLSGTRSDPVQTAASRTHTVAAGETPAMIARKYSVKLESLMTANPGLDARRMKVGQVLRIPPS